MDGIDDHRQGDTGLQAFADATPVMIWISSSEASFDFVNAERIRFTGRSLEEAIGNGWTEDVHPEDLDRCLAAHASAFDVRERFEAEYRLRRHDGMYRWIRESAAPHFTPAGDFRGYIGSATDIHDCRETAAHLQRLLNDPHLRFAEATEAEIRRRVNNSLQLISSYLLLHAAELTDPKLGEFLEGCLVRIHAMGLVHDGLQSHPAAVLDLGTFVTEVCRRLLDNLDHGESLRLDVDLQPLPADRDLAVLIALIATEAVTNIVSESFADGHPGAMLLSLRVEQATAALGIADNGAGMMPSDSAELSSRLRVAQALAGRIGGTIRHLRSRGGSLFQLSFPIAGGTGL